MAIILKTAEQIRLMKEAGRITGEAILKARDMIRPGVSTWEVDRVIHDYIVKCGAKPSFLGYAGFPGSACVSVNSEVIHGIPSRKRILEEGDLVKVDVGALYRGYHGDSAKTFAVGRVSPEATRLIERTRECFYRGVAKAVAGNRIGDVGHAVQACAEEAGFSVVREYVGHGVGSHLHEEPDVPNYGTEGRGCRLYAGMTIAIEPMVNAGGAGVRVLPDGWTVVTSDGRLSAHYEHTVAITDDGPVLLTDVGE
ncbi:MAG: type I methionyl aminopeptidase [Clostridia bacterium]|nr:type I methionyl aminopeptidase [Clostridia bacterium]